jgi:hypothetical protein
MINHISISAHNPKKVANVFAKLWNGYVFPFMACPDSFIVLAGDQNGTAIEITPINIELLPGEGLPVEDESFNLQTPTEEFEAKFTPRERVSEYTATHININTHLDADAVRAIAEREGWRVLTCNRGGGLFQLIEIWAENRFMIEVFTPETQERYAQLMQPEVIAGLMQMPLPSRPVAATNLNLVG